MKKSFELGQSNEIVASGQFYDLHNCYDLADVSFPDGRTFTMRFTPNAESGAKCREITIRFAEVDHLEFRIAFLDRQAIDLDEMGYKKPDDRDDSWLLTEDQADSDDHLFFRLGGENYVRIHSKKADLSAIGTEGAE